MGEVFYDLSLDNFGCRPGRYFIFGNRALCDNEPHQMAAFFHQKWDRWD